MGIEFDEVRVPLRRRDRPEVEELTGQRWVPVLVHDGEVIHDSHRILEFLDYVEKGAGSVKGQAADGSREPCATFSACGRWC